MLPIAALFSPPVCYAAGFRHAVFFFFTARFIHHQYQRHEFSMIFAAAFFFCDAHLRSPAYLLFR